MRCPNASCRAIFEVHELSSPQPPEKGPGGIGPEKEIRTPQSATDRDILEPIPVGEPIPTSVLMQGGGIPQGTVSVEQVIPLCSAEMVDPGPPMDKTPSMEPTEVPWRLRSSPGPPTVVRPGTAAQGGDIDNHGPLCAARLAKEPGREDGSDISTVYPSPSTGYPNSRTSPAGLHDQPFLSSKEEAK